MKLITMFVAFIVGAFAAAAGYAGAQRSVDARTLDIAGVKTGMDYDQALHAVIEHFHVTVSQIRPDPLPVENAITHTKLPMNFVYEKDGVRLQVSFVPRVPVDRAHPLAVASVDYVEPYTRQNVAEMTKAAIAKYGIQSNAPTDLPLNWCEKPSDNPGIGCSTDPGSQAILELSQVHMKLTDPAWRNAVDSYLDNMKSTKPNF